MKKAIRYQAGMTTTSWLLVAALAGFFLTLLFKLGPVYLNNMSVRSAMKSMAINNSNFHDISKSEIYKQIGSYFTINGVRDHNPRDMDIVRKKELTLINHEYEVRVPLFLNVDAVLTFKNQIDSSNIEKCCKYLVDDET